MNLAFLLAIRVGCEAKISRTKHNSGKAEGRGFEIKEMFSTFHIPSSPLAGATMYSRQENRVSLVADCGDFVTESGKFADKMR